MSNNQKQAPSVVSQPQTRYPQGPFIPQRTDAYHVATPPTYVQQPPPNQGNNQVQSLRGMQQTGPPNQASTPPNADLKVQMPPQQPSMNLAYVSQIPVRGPAQNLYQPRAPQPTTQSSRMAGHRQGQQHMFPAQTQFVPIMQQSVPYINSPQYFNGAPRPQPSFVAPFPMLPGQLPAYSYQTAQTQPTFYYGQPSIQIQRPPLSSVATVQQNPTQPSASAMPLPQPPPQVNSMRSKKRKFALPIIDPVSGKDKLMEIYDQQDDSHPASGESSARQTPQPSLQTCSKEVQAAFVRQVTEAIKDVVIEYDNVDPISHLYSLPPQVVPHQGYDSIIQTSKLQVATKEFVPAALNNISKETTPVVSAITDAVEVTITSKPKDRESPIKIRKLREQTVKEPVHLKEKDDTIVCEKPVSIEESEVKDSITTNTATNKETLITSDLDISKIQISAPIFAIPELPVSAVEEMKFADDSESLDTVPLTNTDTVASVAKTKQSSTKTKELPQQPQQVLPPSLPVSRPHVTSTTPSPPLPVLQKVVQPAPMPIPVPQPTKPNNKTNKMRDINIKGALKEGTDMDAFNDNTEDDNITNADYVNSDYVNNDNSSMLNNNEDANKNNDITTIKPIIETKLKSKFDVMDIVKDTPKPIKPISVALPVESPDEVDRAVLANDKIVQAKNEANTKASTDIIDVNLIETKLNLPYLDDQWSPANPDGKKIYGFDFLLALRNDPKSKLKPDNIPTDILANDARGRAGDINRYPAGGRQTDFAPNFGNNVYANKNSQRGTIVKRKSQQGASSGGIKAGSRPSVIRVSISVKEDVKLREVENAWRPARLVQGENLTEDDKKTAELYKKVRGVLNKLTPQKFSQLLDQVKTLNIDTSDRLQGVIDLVFEKAVDEPNFSVAYANLCKELSMMQVPTGSSKRKDREGQPPEFVNFRKLLVTRCQLEFEKNSADESERNEKVKELELCEDPERKKDMQLDLDEYDRRLRMKSVGNIRFIGELFKQNMLTVNIMVRCLNNLAGSKDEENLECLCKLMSTVGKELELRCVDLNEIFGIMGELADKRNGDISSRVRFMIQDVIDLRHSQWVPRRQDFNPKTMDQIQKEAENEQLEIQAMNAAPMPLRKDDRLTSGGGSSMHNERKTRRNVGSDEGGWQTTQSRNSRSTQINVQYDKLKTVTPLNDEPLGSRQMFNNWSAGVNVKPGGNIYSALENIGTDGDKRMPSISIRPHSKDHYNSKGASLERSYRQFDDGRGSRSGSQHRSRDSSASHSSSQQSSIAPISIHSTFAVPNIPTAAMPRDQPNVVLPNVEMSFEEIETQLKKVLEDYLNDLNVTECDNDVKRLFPPSALPKVVAEACNSVLERSKTARISTGQLFAKLIKLGTISIDDYCIGLTEVLSGASDLIIDIPKLWDYLGELIAPVSCEGVLTMRDLYKCCDLLISENNASKLLIPLFNLIIQEKSPNFLHSIWSNSGLSLSNFMQESQVDNFITENKFECLLNADLNCGYKPSGILSQEEIYNKLVAFFKSNTFFDDIVSWITGNVGDNVTQLPFIRTLATVCFEESIVQNKFKFDILKSRFNLIQRYVDRKPEYELQCLFALQAFINKLEHPSGVLLMIFDKIYEENLISHESFLAWEENIDPAEQEGKGVALKQLTSFFTQLKEADDEESCGSSEETGG